MKPNHTKEQRKLLFMLARLLDKVPKKKFYMGSWCNRGSEALVPGFQIECGTTACAIGWGMTSEKIRGDSQSPQDLLGRLGFKKKFSDWVPLFGANRGGVTPKRVAADIRRYLKDGTLPVEA